MILVVDDERDLAATYERLRRRRGSPDSSHCEAR